jgi:isopentenyldiphosphate isomerase
MIIDIVDGNDEVVGKKEKDIVHKDGDWHRVAHVWVFNSKGEVLCHKRADCKKLFPSLWDMIIGGHTDVDESYKDAVVREAAEEIGIRFDIERLAEIGKWKGVANPTEPNNREFIKIFAVKHDASIESLKPKEDEISELKFISLQKLKEMSKNEQEKKRFVSFVYFDDIVESLENFINPKNK